MGKNRDSETNVAEVIRKAMKVRGYTNEMLAKELGYASASGTSMVLSGRRIRVDTAIAALDALGFDIIVRDRKASNKENVWTLELKESDAE